MHIIRLHPTLVSLMAGALGILTPCTAEEVPAKRFVISDFGAVADGRMLNTAAIQKAIDTATAGGRRRDNSGRYLA